LPSSRDRLRDAAKTLFAQRGFEGTSTSEICRLAGTSPSQLVSHFKSKVGLLEAIFEGAWEQINPAIRLAAENVTLPVEKLKLLADMMLRFLSRDADLLTIFLLEARRIRGGDSKVRLVSPFLEFVRTIDNILKQMAAQGELLPGVHPQALRSALMGAFEGLARDRMLARSSGFPASYSEEDLRAVFDRFLSSCLRRHER
jgi:AcrR family transcriptional regulator